MYSAINDIRDINCFLCNFYMDEDFLEAILKQDYLLCSDKLDIDNLQHYLDESKKRNYKYRDRIDKILLKEMRITQEK